MAKIAVSERHAQAAVERFHRIRARTSRVLAATSAFSMLSVEVAALGQQLRTLAALARVSEESFDRKFFENELARRNREFLVLQTTYAAELAPARPAPPSRREGALPTTPLRRWWRVWG